MEENNNQLQRVLSKMSSDDREVITRHLMVSTQETYSGPIPPPKFLAELNNVVDNGAERLVSTYEKQVNHRISLETKESEHNIKMESRGQIYGFILTILLVMVAALFVFTGHEVLSSIIFGSLILGVLTIFVLRKVPSFHTNGKDE